VDRLRAACYALSDEFEETTVKVSSRVIIVAAALALALSGCAGKAPVEPPANPLGVTTTYDRVWTAAYDALAEEFPIYYANKQLGTIRSDYRLGGSFMEPWAVQASDGYDLAEESLNIVRRQATASIATEDGRLYNVSLEIVRQRQGFAHPEEPAFADEFDVMDSRVTPLRRSDQVSEGASWVDMGRDTALESRILARVYELAVQ